MTEKQIKVFNKEYLKSLLERDHAILENEKEKLNGNVYVAFTCRCGKSTEKLFRDIAYYAGAYCKDCIKKIRVNKIRETCIEKYGVVNPSCIDDIKIKKEETHMKHFGMHPRKTEEVKEKYKNTCLKRYNTDNPAKVKEVKQKIKDIFIEKYGGHPMFDNKIKEKVKDTCFERYGGSPMNTITIKNKIRDTCNSKYGCHPSQTIEVQEKIQNNGKKYKQYQMPSGEFRNIQGYENFAMDKLITEYTEEQIKSNRSDVPRIPYMVNNIQRYYFPDIYIPHINLIIEVKSSWTYKKDEEVNKQKETATKALGYSFEFWIFTQKGVRMN